MAKICMTEKTHDKHCTNCAHYMFDVNYGEYCCYAKPNELGEVKWAPQKKETVKKSCISFSSACG